MQEKWKDIKGYKGLYQISNFGRVKRVECNITGIAELDNKITGTIQHRTIKWSNVHEKILKPAKCGDYGHLFVVLTKNKKSKPYLLSRLVANHFIKKPNNDIKYDVFHKDFNQTNNNVENLKWITRKELLNLDYVIHNRRENFIKKSSDYEKRIKQSRLKGGKEIKFIYSNGLERKLPSIGIGASVLDVDESSIRKCLTGKIKTVKGCKVQFA